MSIPKKRILCQHARGFADTMSIMLFLTDALDYTYNSAHIRKGSFIMKTVILFGSPRKNGNTIQLVQTMTDALKKEGHSVRMLYLNDLNIRPCQGMLYLSQERVL
jgi:hypothetical protein